MKIATGMKKILLYPARPQARVVAEFSLRLPLKRANFKS
jgi:hypothetical protein